MLSSGTGFYAKSCEEYDWFSGYTEFDSTAKVIANGFCRNLASSFNIRFDEKIKNNPLDWDSNDIAQFNNFKMGDTRCLQNFPLKIFESPTCGNGFVEEDEECDCGFSMECSKLCCDPNTCKLLPKTSCKTGKLNSYIAYESV